MQAAEIIARALLERPTHIRRARESETKRERGERVVPRVVVVVSVAFIMEARTETDGRTQAEWIISHQFYSWNS